MSSKSSGELMQYLVLRKSDYGAREMKLYSLSALVPYYQLFY